MDPTNEGKYGSIIIMKFKVSSRAKLI